MVVAAAAPLIPLGAKILGAAKGLLAGGKALGAAAKTGKMGMSAYKALKGAGVAPQAARFAGSKINTVARGLTSPAGFAKNLGLPPTKAELATMVAPDLLFGGMAAVTTEGDLIDKAIAGTGAAAGGIVGGAGLRGVLGPKSGVGIIGTEMIGGMIGDQVGYGIADNIIRAKHGGMTPAEQGYAAQDDQYRAQLMAELKQQYGV